MRYFSLVPVVFVLASIPGRSAVVSIASQKLSPGQVAIAPLVFSSEGGYVSGVQFDLDWDPALDVKLVIGDQLRASTKLLFVAPKGPRSVRCLIVGMDLAIISDGELLKVFLIASPQASPGTAQLHITNTAATDPAGNPLALGPATVGVEIQSGATTSVAVPDTGVLNAASLLPGPISPGEIITLLGGLPAAKTVALLFNGIPAPILYAGPNQVNAVVPFGLDLTAPATLDVRIGDNPVKVPLRVAAATPALFTQTATGGGPGAILNQDYSVNSASNPATRGSVVMLYGTGFGALDPQPADGQIAGAAPTRTAVTATVDGVPAVVTYSGAAPGLIAGVIQINVQIPAVIAPNPAAAVMLTVGAAAIPAGVTIAVE
jgi:uncharacterized protein (TIGR03437 family)